jgi:hypothetical protein
VGQVGITTKASDVILMTAFRCHAEARVRFHRAHVDEIRVGTSLDVVVDQVDFGPPFLTGAGV